MGVSASLGCGTSIRDTDRPPFESEMRIGLDARHAARGLGIGTFVIELARALSADPNPNIVFQAVKRNLSDVKPLVTKARKADYHEGLLDGLRVYHNPEATHKLDKGIFRNNDVFQSYYSEEKQDWVYEDRTGLLLFRRVLTAIKTVKSDPACKKSDGVREEES